MNFDKGEGAVLLLSMTRARFDAVIRRGKCDARRARPAVQASREAPAKVHIYVSGTGAVLGSCLLCGFQTLPLSPLAAAVTGMPLEKLRRYADAAGNVTVWELSARRVFERPRPLSDYARKTPPRSFCYIR